jgi:hypothetical protein
MKRLLLACLTGGLVLTSSLVLTPRASADEYTTRYENCRYQRNGYNRDYVCDVVRVRRPCDNDLQVRVDVNDDDNDYVYRQRGVYITPFGFNFGFGNRGGYHHEVRSYSHGWYRHHPRY